MPSAEAVCACGTCPPCRWIAAEARELEQRARITRLAHLASEWSTEAYHCADAGDPKGAGRAAAQAERFARTLQLEVAAL